MCKMSTFMLAWPSPFTRGFACALVIALTGCGYTILEHPQEAVQIEPEETEQTALPAGDVDELVLPPGHPLILDPEDWVGRSFLDDLVGMADPLRFENLRASMIAPATFEHATLTVRITIGGPGVLDIWQIRMDEFGWTTAAHWTQGQAGPELDEALAPDRVEFRIERESEAALRTMMIDLLPQIRRVSKVIRPQRLEHVPLELWPYDEPGLIEIDYRIETLDTLNPEDWPGGRLSAQLDMIQVLIGTWDTAPPLELQRAVWALARDRALLLNMALLIEGIVLAWEVEGHDQEAVDLPLWVGR